MAQGGGKERERENCYNISVSLASGSRFISVAACCLFSLPLTTAVNTEFFAHFKYTMMHGRLVHGRSLIESPLRRYRPVFFFFRIIIIFTYTHFMSNTFCCVARMPNDGCEENESRQTFFMATHPHIANSPPPTFPLTPHPPQ